MGGRQEHHSMEVEDFSFCVDDSGTEYVTFKENPTKTRQGELNTKHRSVQPQMFTTGDPKCLVQLLKQYLSKRPQELRDIGPFYHSITTKEMGRPILHLRNNFPAKNHGKLPTTLI